MRCVERCIDHAVDVPPTEKPRLPKLEAWEFSGTGPALHGFRIAAKISGQFTDVKKPRIYICFAAILISSTVIDRR